MKQTTRRLSIIWSIVCKDLKEFSRDKLWMVLTPMSLLVMIALFWVMPAKVDETVLVGVYPQDMATLLGMMKSTGEKMAKNFGSSEQVQLGMEIVPFGDKKTMVSTIKGSCSGEDCKDMGIGIAFPDNFMSEVKNQKEKQVVLHLTVDVPSTFREAVPSQIRELSYILQDFKQGRNPLDNYPVSMLSPQKMVLGQDKSGRQIPLREKMRPLLLFLVLMMDALALAGLVATEIELKTASAIMVTPATTSDLILAKGLTGAILGFIQTLIFLVASLSFGLNPVQVLLLVLTGAFLVSGVGMLAGSSGQGFITNIFIGALFLIPLMIPPVALLYPGEVSLWVKLMPSWGITKGLVESYIYGLSWKDFALYLGVSFLWIGTLFLVARAFLKRKVVQL
ncbi:MAG: ABC transporter permease [Myxococcota bacterium]